MGLGVIRFEGQGFLAVSNARFAIVEGQKGRGSIGVVDVGVGSVGCQFESGGIAVQGVFESLLLHESISLRIEPFGFVGLRRGG